MAIRKRILFVDDERNVLEGLERMLRPMRLEWECAFADNAQKALELMEAESFDVLVTDIRMPNMDGAELLDVVANRYPNVVRIVLSGHYQQEMIMKAVGPAHQYLRKPCDADTLKDSIMRVCALQDLLADKELRQLVTRMKSLPALPTAYTELVGEIAREDASIEKIATIIEQDVAMSAKVLQVVNSAFFGLRQRVTSPRLAVTYLGFDNVKALSLSVSVFSHLSNFNFSAISVEQIWEHSMRTAGFAKIIATCETTDRKQADDAFLAGFLHDAGRLILLSGFPTDYAKMVSVNKQYDIPLWLIEQSMFHASHAELGAYLLGLWGLQQPIVEAVAWHHRPRGCPSQSFGLLTAVHIADLIERELSNNQDEIKLPDIDNEYLDRIGMIERVPIWVEQCVKSQLEDAA